MPYCRHVLAEKLPIDGAALALDENRAVLRFLKRVTPRQACGLSVRSAEVLKTTDKLAERFVPLSAAEHCYETDDGLYVIQGEGILDKRLPEFARLWGPGTHFVFYLDPARGVKIDPKGALTYFTRRNTAELIRYLGGTWIFDLWVRNPEAAVTECARSVTTAPGTAFITNLASLGEPWHYTDVMKGGASKWLNLAYRLTAEKKTVSEDARIDFTFEVLDGRTGIRAEDVNYDDYRIEAVDGYVPHTRLTVKKGIGRFRAYALCLNKGETLRVKINKSFQSDLAEAIVPVV